MVPALARPGSLEPPLIFAAFLMRCEAGGVRISKENDRSEKTVIFTGIGAPCSRSLVLALNCLQNSMIDRPSWPSAGPIGGDGLAWPAATCKLMQPSIFFAMTLL